MPKAREGEEHERGIPPLIRGLGIYPRKFFNYRRMYVLFIAFWKLLGAQNFSHSKSKSFIHDLPTDMFFDLE